jgi:ferredoxin--NADP+ reductase
MAYVMTMYTTVEIPSNLYKPTAPLQAKVLETRLLTDPNSANEVKHIVFDIAGSELRYLEGQSIGVLPPGEDANGKPHKLRLYSIASERTGDSGNSQSLSLCVKRAITVTDDGTVYKGVCSSFLCDLNKGDTVSLTGPVGKSFLMPPDLDANLIMVATGTGIAPFRGFLKRRVSQNINQGQAWLFFGAQTQKDYLYKEEMEAITQSGHGRIHTAFSREQKSPEGGRRYVQHDILEQSEHLLEMLQKPKSYFYMCGLRGMESGIQEALNSAALKHSVDWPALQAKLKEEKRWHVEVY